MRASAAVGQSGLTLGLEARDPGVDALAGYTHHLRDVSWGYPRR